MYTPGESSVHHHNALAFLSPSSSLDEDHYDGGSIVRGFNYTTLRMCGSYYGERRPMNEAIPKDHLSKE